ncbi:MAG: glycosyltransferase [Candidatus Flexifilum sp.]
MKRLIYLANIRLPTEKAHGLQIMENCAAFAGAGLDVSLWIARRRDRGPLAGRDPFAHYGLPPRFRIRRLPTLDLLWLVPERDDGLARLIFGLQLVTYLIAALIGALVTRADLYYSRDERAIALLGLFKPAQSLVYEAHTLAQGRIGRWLQARACRSAGLIVPVTGLLRDDLVARGAPAARMLVAPDGIRADRFAMLPDQRSARSAVGWPENVFIVGYVGRLHTMKMGKGVDVLVQALAGLETMPAALALVGGPDEAAQALRADWIAAGGEADRFLYAGQVAPDRVPVYLAAFDVCVMPLPATAHFARHASPLKLFEYMAAGRPIIATALPSFGEILTDSETALLIPPDDPEALRDAVRLLYADPTLRHRLGQRAREIVLFRYTWDARAHTILKRVDR